MSYDFQIVRKGYNPDEVDAYIEELENRLNEYKDKSSTINKAIINAQIAADNIIKAAHSETEKILSQAKKDAAELKQSTLHQIKYLKLNIANQKNLIENFRKDYEFLTEKYLNPLVTSDTDKVFDKLTEIEEMIDNLSLENAASESNPSNKGEKAERFQKKPNRKGANNQPNKIEKSPEIDPNLEYTSSTLTAEETQALLS